MLNICILVLLYNKKPLESKTINSLIKHSHNLQNCSITIWNNGPKKIFETSESKQIQIGDSDVKFIETPNNISLSEIYNRFINDNKSEKYIILDDDSTLTYEYLHIANTIKTNGALFPIIKCHEEFKSPIVNNTTQSITKKISSNDNILAIGSGIIISENLISIFKNNYENIFDERFRFYGVDITFCYRLNILRKKYKFTVMIIDGFSHSLSKMEIENKKMKSFRQKERSYDLSLRLKYYYSKPKSLLILSNAVIKSLFMSILNMNPKYNYLDLIKSYASGKHYKD